MKTIQHFKKLCDIVKEQGIGAALKHDAIETAKRHPKLASGASLLYSSIFNSEYVPIDRHTALRQKRDGSWKVEVNLPRAYQLRHE